MGFCKKIAAFGAVCSLVLTSFGTTAMAEEIPGYQINGTYDKQSGILEAEVSVYGVKALVGRLALDYDADKLILLNKNQSPARSDDQVENIVENNTVEVTAEGNSSSKLINLDDGYVMFAWYMPGGALDASGGGQKIATLYFETKDEVTDSDFDAATLKLKQVEDGEVRAWDSGAYLKADGFEQYKNNVSGVKQCAVSFTYPNAEVTPVYARNVSIKVTDSKGKAVSGTVTVGSEKIEIDSRGYAKGQFADGKYTLSINAVGYGTIVDTLIVAGSEISKAYTVKNDEEIVKEDAAAIKIGYASNNSAQNVTKSLKLPLSGEGGSSISWRSSKPDVINSYGAVLNASERQEVILTASVKKNSASATREFTVTVANKQEAYEQNKEEEQKETTTKLTPEQQERQKLEEELSKAVFADLDSVPWARDSIEMLAQLGIISGTGSTTFSPQSNIKRGDFMALLVRMLNPQGESNDGFADVPKDSYYYKEITLAKGLGIASGIGDNCFNPEGLISREDMMSLTYRALVLSGKLTEEGASSKIDSFRDSQTVASYARDAVARLIDEGFISGNENGEILPKNKATRAETAVFLANIYRSFSF